MPFFLQAKSHGRSLQFKLCVQPPHTESSLCFLGGNVGFPTPIPPCSVTHTQLRTVLGNILRLGCAGWAQSPLCPQVCWAAAAPGTGASTWCPSLEDAFFQRGEVSNQRITEYPIRIITAQLLALHRTQKKLTGGFSLLPLLWQGLWPWSPACWLPAKHFALTMRQQRCIFLAGKCSWVLSEVPCARENGCPIALGSMGFVCSLLPVQRLG